MTTEKLQEYINCLELGNGAFRAVSKHPLVEKIKSSDKLRYWIPDRTTPDPIDTSHLEALWTTKASAKNIAAFLRLNGYSVDFKTSTVSKDGGKNNQKVGRVLHTLNPKLLESWKKLTNETFSTKTDGSKKWVISANPEDVCASSYKRKWTSCTSDGHHMVNIARGRFSFIAYLCDKEDTGIKTPHCRFLIHIGIPQNKNAPKSVVFYLEGDNIPPARRSLTVNIAPENKDELIGILFLDTKYGNCSSGEFAELSEFITRSNDEALELNKLMDMAISINGLYLNTYDPPRKITHSSCKTDRKVIIRKKPAIVVDALAIRVNQYSTWSNRPSYELVEYVINNGHYHNSNLNNAIFGDPEFSKFLSVEVVDSNISQVRGNLDEHKKKIVGSIDYKDIVKITKDIEICVKHYDALVKIKEKMAEAKQKTSSSKYKCKLTKV